MPEFSFTPVDFDPFEDKNAEKKAREYAKGLPETPAPSGGVLGDIATHTGGAYSPYTPFLVAGSMAKGLVDSVGAAGTLVDRVRSGEVDVMHGGNEEIAKEALNAGLLTLGGGMARAGLKPVVEPNSLGMFLGQTARRLPIGSVENKFLGPEGLPRFEISDAGSSLTPRMEKFLSSQKNTKGWKPEEIAQYKKEMEGLTPTKLSEVIDHPELFEAYPEFKNLPVKMTGNGSLGWYQSGQKYGEPGIIGLDPSRHPEDIHSTTLHEIQHAIQHREGFPRGANPEMFADSEFRNEIEPLVKERDALLRKKWNGVKSAEEPNTWTPEEQARFDELQDFYHKFLNWHEQWKHTNYKRAAGEVEARNVQDRRLLEPEHWSNALGDNFEFYHPGPSTEDVPRAQQNLLAPNTPSDAMRLGAPGNAETGPLVNYGPMVSGKTYDAVMPGWKDSTLRSTGIPVPGLSGVTVDNSGPVPYGAGADSSRDDHVHIDSRIPEYHSGFVSSKTGEPLSLYKYLAIHELAEKPMMEGLIRNGMTEHQAYLHAHYGAATPAERLAVEADGGDWAKYEEIMDGYLSKTEKESLKGASSSLYVKPYPHSKEKMLDLATHHLAGKEGAPK